MQPDFPYQPTPQRGQFPDANALYKPLLLAATVVGIFTAAYFVVSGIQARQSTGLLAITASSPKATISITQGASATKKVGTGSAKLRLQPGSYQVVASDGGSGSTITTTVTKEKTTTAKLDLSAAVPITTVAKYSAHSLFPTTDGKLYFLNLLEDTPYVYDFASRTARPYLVNVVNNADIMWLNPTKLISESGDGTFTYIDGDNADILTYEDTGAPSTGISMNASGKIAFVTEESTVRTADSPTASPVSLGITQSIDAKASIAPNGNVLVYTPDIQSGTLETTQLYVDGNATTLPDALQGINNIAWRADSQAFSYTTIRGMYIYDIATKRITRVTSTTPTNPGSALWLNDSTILYAYSGSIWKYTIGSKQTQKINSFEGTLPGIQPFVLAADGKTVYYSTTTNAAGRGGNIYSFAPDYNSLPAEEQQAIEETQQKQEQPDTSLVGFEELMPRGLSDSQLASLKSAAATYANSLNTPVKTIALSNPNFVVDTTDAPNYYTFTLKYDDKEYYGKMDVSGVSRIRLTLFNDNALVNQVYDSGTLDTLQ